MNERTAVVVLGMYKSGVGALADALGAAGLALPTISDASAKGPGGPPAPVGVVQLNNRILKDMGATWDDPRLLTIRGHDLPTGTTHVQLGLVERYIAAAEKALAADFPQATHIVLRDPRVAMFRELWDTALRRCRYRPRYVIVFRNPVEMAQSLRVDTSLGMPRAHQLWLRYNLAALDLAYAERLAAVISYEKLLAAPGSVLKQLLDGLGGPWSNLGDDARAAVVARISLSLRHHTVAAETIRRSPMIAGGVKAMFDLLDRWTEQPASERTATIAQMGRGFEEFCLLAGNYVTLPPTASARKPAPQSDGTPPAKRRIIVHYHLFKNAGTSVDAVLEKSFGRQWLSREFATSVISDQQQELNQLISANPTALAMSSHTLLLPLPQIADVEIFPIIFVRHPLDRLKSAYDFERDQNADTLGSRLARQTDFAGYVRGRLAILSDRTCRNFQVHRFAMACPGSTASEVSRALEAVDMLPFVGLVESFAESMQRLERLIKPTFPDFQGFSVRMNATAGHHTLDDKLQRIRTILGADLFAEVETANAADMQLYNKVKASYAGIEQGRSDNPVLHRPHGQAPSDTHSSFAGR